MAMEPGMAAVTRLSGGWQGVGGHVELRAFAQAQRARLAALASLAPWGEGLREATRVASPLPPHGPWGLRASFGEAGPRAAALREMDLEWEDNSLAAW